MVASINIPKDTALNIDKQKRSIEARTQAVFKRIFNDIADDAEALYRTRGNINAKEIAENYRADFLTNIRRAYRQTIKKFGFELRGSINRKYFLDFDIEYKKQLIDLDYKQTIEIQDTSLEENIEGINSQFQEEATLFIANQSEEQADLITKTNENEIEKAIAFGSAVYFALLTGKRNEADELNQRLLTVLNQPKETRKIQNRLDKITNEIERLSRDQQRIIAKEIKDKIKKDGISRSELIASQEVGVAESWSREKEAEIINNTTLTTPTGQPVQLFKEWVATLDRRTREAHISADGQRVLVNEPFSVGGELLQFPRDPRGSAGNVINCRCVAIYDSV
jgi:hypothetical protein